MRAPLRLPVLFLSVFLFSGCSVGLSLRKADKLYGYGEYYAASTQYGKAYRRLKASEKKKRAHASFYRAECYRLLSRPIKAESEYKKALRYQLGNDTLQLRLAQTLHKNAKYGEAAKAYEDFLSYHPDDELALNGLSACHLINTWEKSPTRYVVKKATGLNSRKGDFSPVLMPEDYLTLIFSSSALMKKEQKPSNITGLPDNDFWESQQDVNGKWSKPECMTGGINSEFDEGAGTFSSDGKTLYFTRCITKSDSIESTSQVELFRSIRSGAEWSEPEKLTVHRDSTKIFAHPAASPDGRYLYFISDIAGGYGGKDIWRCEMQDNTFGPPENLGPDINTPGDEVFPSFRQNGDLYFSSDGLPGFGGLDLFKATPKPKSGYIVENMMQQINSSGDDFGITFFGKEERGFFSSNRKEPKGWDKLYSFELPVTTVEVRGIVQDRFGEPIPDATIRVVNDKGLNTKTRADKSGQYTLRVEKDADYVMLGTCRSYLNNSNRFYAYNKEADTTYIRDFVLTPLHRAIRIENILFEFGKWELKPESYPALEELIKIMQDNPHIVVEIGAHTDRIGTDEYNNELSGKRAEAVVEYLQTKGIEKARLEAHGYGKTQPAVVESYMQDKYRFLPEGSNLTEGFIESLPQAQQEAADQINRRCEFKVLKTTYKLF
jgi:peptidoglycan-associated lipoprotein